MIIFNNQEFNSFKELREKCHLISKWQVMLLCHCRANVVKRICDENKIENYSVVADGKDCIVFDESIINLINKVRPKKDEVIPGNYILRTELAKFLGVTLHTLSDIEFWCWAFKDYKKTFTVKGLKKVCYKFNDEAKAFYAAKLHKWKYPDRTKCTCY